LVGILRNFLPSSLLIMSSRISKSRSRKSIERDSAAAFIALNGEISDMPCTYCHKNGKACKFAQGRKDCGECVRRGRSCDGVFVGRSREYFDSSVFLSWLMLA
jgi:hypothetical protein